MDHCVERHLSCERVRSVLLPSSSCFRKMLPAVAQHVWHIQNAASIRSHPAWPMRIHAEQRPVIVQTGVMRLDAIHVLMSSYMASLPEHWLDSTLANPLCHPYLAYLAQQ